MRQLREICARDLTAGSVRDAVGRDGSVIVRDLAPQPAVEQLTRDIDLAFAARERDGDTAPWYVEYDDRSSTPIVTRPWLREHGGLLGADSPPALADLMTTYRQVGLLELLTEYLGDSPAMSANKTTLRRADASVATDWWHQDGAFLGAEIRTLNVWLSLSHCGVDAPGIDVVARRIDEIVPTGGEGADFGWSVAPDVLERIARDDVVRPVFAPGDALFLDNFTLHRTGLSPSMSGVRYAIETWFFAASTPPIHWMPMTP
jgi:hypothetical protein